MNMPLVLLNRRRRGGSFSPYSLFSGTAIGTWFDPSDLATMYQDAAGTTAVTTPGQPVGLRLDKSKGLALGAELVANGDFAAGATGWQVGGGWTVSGGAASTVAGFTDVLYQNMTLVAGRTYQISFDLSGASGGTYPSFGGGSTVFGPLLTANQRHTVYLVAVTGNTDFRFYKSAAGAAFTVDNISVRELPGNHATQSVLASRPVYGIEPAGGRRNLLTWSEDYSNAAWFKGAGATATASSLSAVAGSGNHWIFRGDTVTGTQTLSVEAKADTVSWVALGQGTAANTFFNLSTGALGTVASGHTASIVSLGSGWYRCIVTLNFTTVNASILVANADNVSVGYTAAGTERISLRNAQLELGSTATPYQKVVTAFDVTEAGVQSCHYVQYDGSDDSLSTSAIDFTATDKMSVFAGVRKLSEHDGVIVESSANWFGNNGSFSLASIPSPHFTYSPGLRGTASAYYSSGINYAPNSAVLSALFDIAGTSSSQEVALRSDGTMKALTSVVGTSSGTGNFLAYPLYIGRRGNASLPFNGRDYGIIIVGKAASAGEITDTELWLSDKTSEVDVAKSISPNIYTRSGDTILDRANSIIERRTV